MFFFKFLKFHRYNQSSQGAELPENVVVPASESAMDELVLGCSWTGTSAMIPSNVAQLDYEFRLVLISLNTINPTATNSTKSKRYSTSSCSRTDSAPSFDDCDFVKLNAVNKDVLRSIAERMNSAGILGKAVEVYQSVRKPFLDTSLRKLGIKKLSMNDIRSLEWEELEEKIEQWIRAANIWVGVLFASERRLCKHVFGGLGNNTDDNCFAETVKDPAFQLFKIGKALSICTSYRSRRPEKLFKVLDLHQMLLQLLDGVDIIFRSKTLESVGIEAAEMLSQLAKAAREILPQFENEIFHEQSHFQDHRGGIDNLTKYVMRYVTEMASYKEGLTRLILTKPDCMTIPDIKLAQVDWCTPFVVHLIWIIEILQFKLEAKSKRYKDASLAQLFMMNNVHYIVEKIREAPDLGEMVGDIYLEMLIENVQLVMDAYLGLTWDRVLYCLRDEGLYVSGGQSLKVSKSVLRERFKTFNATLEEVHQAQAKWVVPNQKVRNKLRHSISEKLIPAYSSSFNRFESLSWNENQSGKLIPAYRSIFKRFKSLLGDANQQEKYIKYTVEDLKTLISNIKKR